MMTERGAKDEDGLAFWKYSHSHTHLLTFDLLGREVVALHRVAPALAVAPARKGRGLGAGPQRGQGHRPRFSAKTDGALGDKKRSVQKKNKNRMVTCAAAIASAGMLPSGGGGPTEMDWMRFKAEVLAGVMTPVRLLDLATGLTLLLQGS